MRLIVMMLAAVMVGGAVYADEASDRFAEAQRRLAERQKAAEAEKAKAATRPAPVTKPAAVLGSRERPYTIQTALAAIPADLRETEANQNNQLLQDKRREWIAANLVGKHLTTKGPVGRVYKNGDGRAEVSVWTTPNKEGVRDEINVSLDPSFDDRASRLKEDQVIQAVGVITRFSSSKWGGSLVRMKDGSF